jgi:hypothetical protein
LIVAHPFVTCDSIIEDLAWGNPKKLGNYMEEQENFKMVGLLVG